MEYSKIVAVTGLPGLYELISSRNDGAIVRSPEDGKTRFITSRIHNFSHLESIEVFTVTDNVNLVEIFYAMEKASQNMPDAKDDNSVKKYFEKVYPDLDFERVYPSDLKKMVKWYEILKNHKVEIKLSEPEEEPEVEVVPAEPVAEEEPKKEAKKKPAAPKEEKKSGKTAGKESGKTTKAAGKKEKEKDTPKKSAKKK